MTPKVSIITPTYNHERYIGECIDSLLAQTFTDWEQIVVDDGSTDGTLSVVERYNDRRIKIIRHPHRGMGHLKDSYNSALALAKGEFVGVLEGDDYWMPDKLERQLRKFASPGVALVWGPVSWVHKDGRKIATAPSDIGKYQGMGRQAYLYELLLGNFIPALSVMIRRENLTAIGGFQQTPYMVTVDYPTWLQCLVHWEAECVEEVVGCWRRHPVQMSTARQHEILDGTLKFACDFYEALPDEEKALLDLDAGTITQKWESSIAVSCFHEGRKFLVKSNWASARHEFRNSIRKGNGLVRLKSALGMLASYGHFDIEGLVRLMGKEAINDSEIWSG